MKKLLLISIFHVFLVFPSQAQQLLGSEWKGTFTVEEVEQLIDGLAELQFGIRVYKIRYLTTNLEGVPDTASGLLAVPDLQWAVFPTLVFQHGTVDGPADVSSNLRGEWQYLAAAAALGYYALSPDLLGMGDSPGFHPYLHAATEASAAIDMIFAVKAFALQNAIQLNDQLFIAGYSQGGHSAMALHRAIQEQQPEGLTVTASVPMSGAYSLSGVMRDLILSDEDYPFTGFLAYVAMSYNTVYGWYDDLNRMFKPQFVGPMQRFFNREIGFFEMDTLLLFQLRADFGRDLPRLMLQDSVLSGIATDSLHPINKALRENDVFDWTPEAPMRLLYCKGDDRVPYTNSTVADSVMLENGAPDVFAFDVGPTLDHRECIEPSARLAVVFLENFKELVDTEDPVADRMNIRVYPNPAQTFFTLSGAPEGAQIQLLDLCGILHLSVRVRSDQEEIPSDGLPPGLYWLRIVSGKASWTEKIIIQR